LAEAGATGYEWFGLKVHSKFKTLIVQNENNLLAGSYLLGSVPRTVFVLEAASSNVTDNRVVVTCCKNNDGELGSRSVWERSNGLFASVQSFDWEAFDNPETGKSTGISKADVAAIFKNGAKKRKVLADNAKQYAKSYQDRVNFLIKSKVNPNTNQPWQPGEQNEMIKRIMVPSGQSFSGGQGGFSPAVPVQLQGVNPYRQSGGLPEAPIAPAQNTVPTNPQGPKAPIAPQQPKTSPTEDMIREMYGMEEPLSIDPRMASLQGGALPAPIG
jgi:hypothetical protein